jgi:YHS domain-containing protein
MNISKVLVILVLLYVGYRIVMMLRRIQSQNVKGYRMDVKQPKGEDLVQDPLCKTYVPKSQAYIKEIDGRDQYFCSSECCEKYLSGNK